MATSREPSSGAVGWTMFAAIMMIFIGSMHVISGLAGIINDESFAVTKDYIVKIDTTTWGWIHLIGGIIVLLAGFGLFSGKVWARTVGVIVALGSAIVSFAWIPIYPVWGITIIAIDIAVIWALTAHGRDITQV